MPHVGRVRPDPLDAYSHHIRGYGHADYQTKRVAGTGAYEWTFVKEREREASFGIAGASGRKRERRKV
ncbi:hypothetical protein E2C01_018331 [Portunus trituberculatus]|uniref:Uncharacterized protein n=1 Tax=Portunus trituberculatus TaxID=210409 RepID=A0A5B7DW60_PORTR|nr:hypothetical protein [Portunus trituberculatus]